MSYVPGAVFAESYRGEYMAASIPLAVDFYHPRFSEFLSAIAHPFQIHRKLWEFAFIVEALDSVGAIRKGARGLGFGCGTEQLPALFAKRGCSIVATDAPPGASTSDWSEGNQHSDHVLMLSRPEIVDDATLLRQVWFEYCDMNNIPPRLTDFDFVWSACCLEHLGSIQHGLDFIANTVEHTIRVGGYACHTTELNLSSNQDTLETDSLSLFRRKDLERLCGELEERGHTIMRPLIIPVGASPIDYHVDLPPYSDVHLKLQIEKYVCTSVGLLIRRGR